MKIKRLALLGTGYLSSIVANAYKDGYLPEYELEVHLEETLRKQRPLLKNIIVKLVRL